MRLLLLVSGALWGMALTAFAAEPPSRIQIVHPSDGAVMVYVPAGECVLGLDPAEAAVVARHLGFPDAETLWAWDCYPRHKAAIDGYFIDKHEVTVERWKKFVRATGHNSPSQETSRHFDDPKSQQLPAGEITWDEAKAYARWSGKQLPTDAQWEKAARGTDGRLYPWGNDPPTGERGHFGPKDKRPELYVPVGGYPQGASPFGVLDMLGNQYEWTSDWLEPYPGNPQAEKMRDYAGKKTVSVRGGSWYHGWVSFYGAKRFGLKPDETYYHVGFRTVWTPPAGYFESEQFRRDRKTGGY